jgi:hypothetical protein
LAQGVNPRFQPMKLNVFTGDHNFFLQFFGRKKQTFEAGFEKAAKDRKKNSEFCATFRLFFSNEMQKFR